jgi:hypothetical protein
VTDTPDHLEEALLESRRLRSEAQMTRRDAHRARDAIQPYVGPDRRRRSRTEAPLAPEGGREHDARR